ncbi:MAG: protein kinase [Polyangiales bacterium]
MNDPRPAGAAPLAKPQGIDPLIGRVINDRYKVLALVARGGMGKVYRAEQAPLGRLVALKVLNASYVGENDPEFHKRFFLEASIASKLTHPNTVTIHDYGKTEDEILYIAMELLEGRTLHRALREEGPFASERTIHIAKQVCRALREAHGHGVIHRDLKPANVYLVHHGDEADFVKVLDFGLVKNLEEKGEALTQTGLFMGSPKYMSPEQIRGGKVDARADVYALGVMMYEMLCGKVPFDDANSVNILMAHVNEQVPFIHEMNPNVFVSPGLETAVRKCMAKHPDDRFASMDELLGALKRASGATLSATGEHSVMAHVPDDRSGAMPVSVQMPLPGGGTGPLFVGARKPSGNAPLLYVGGFLALTALAAALVIRGAGSSEPPPVEKPQVVADPGPKPAQRPAVAEEDLTDRTVLVSLRSTPPGATVSVEGQEYGPTPTQFEWTGSDAAYGRVVKFLFRRPGYHDLTVTRQVRGDRMDVYAPPLEPLPQPRKRAAGALAPTGDDSR